MNVAILGGAFNPPHLGHLLIAEQTLKFTDIDQVWLTPCYKHTFLKNLAPVKHRIAMTKMLTGEDIRFEASPRDSHQRMLALPKPSAKRGSVPKNVISSRSNKIASKIKFCNEEIRNKLSGDTIELMQILEKKYPTHHFSFLIGSDNLSGFRQWGCWQQLITNYNFLVYPRPGFEMNLSKHNLNNPKYKFQLIQSSLLAKTNISSTEIRKRIKTNLSISHLVPKQVVKYIKSQSLYI